jgi:hypothetical protein
MAILHYTLRSFGGGYVTSIDEAQLSPDQSPSLSNVDMTETNAVSRRFGFAQVSASVMTSKWANAASRSVRRIGRFYPSSGANQWVCISGTAMFTQADGARDVPLTRAEGETIHVGATGISLAATKYSAGYAWGVGASNTCSFTVPYSSGMTAKLFVPAGVGLSASVKVDSGAYTNVAVTATGVSYTPAVSATNHTLWVKLPSMAASTKYEENDSRITYSGYFPRVVDASCSGGYFALRGAGGSLSIAFVGSRCRIYGTKVVLGAHANISVDGGAATEASFYTAGSPAYQSLIFDTGVLAYGAHTVALSYAHEGEGYGTNIQFDFIKVWENGVALDYVDYWAQGSWARRDTTLSATSTRFAMEQMGGKLYYGSEYDNVQGWDGSAVSAVSASGTMAAKFLKAHKNRMWAAGKNADPGLLEYTYIGFPEKWSVPTAGAIRMAATGSGSGCTGLGVLRDRLFWFSDSKTHALTCDGDPVNWKNEAISNSYGCIAPDSVAEAPNVIVFLAADGVRAYGALPSIFSEDGSGFLHISRALTPTLEAYTDAQRKAAIGAYYKKRYWLTIGSDLFIADLDKRTKVGNDKQPVWTRYAYSGLVIKSMHVTRGDEYALYAGGNDGKLYRLDIGESDNGSAISMSYATPPLAIKGYSTTKHFRNVQVALQAPSSQSLTMTPSTDDVSGATSILSASATSDIQPLRAQVNSRGRSLKLTFSSAAAAQPVTISEVDIAFTPPRMR